MRVLILAAACITIAGAVRADAEPLLQLDIMGGYYDSSTQTIISNSSSFTIVALITPTSPDDLLGSYFISAALTPQASTTSSIGSFSWDGSSYQITEDMMYGVPPVEASGVTSDAGDLSPHGIYPTYFREFEFSFSSPETETSATYNTALTPGGPTPGTGSYYRMFNVVTALPAGYSLHFDLYDSYFRSGCGKTSGCTDEDIDHFAPFSHDAESGPVVPEPATLLMLGTGLGILAHTIRRRA